MPKTRIALAGAVACAALASTAPSASATTQDYVTVKNENGVITVSTQLPGQPLLGVRYTTATGQLCAGFSYQVPFCVTLPVDAIAYEDPSVVTVDADASDGSVGVYTQLPGQPLVGVRYTTADSELCVGFSYQIPFCVQLGPIS